MEAATRDGEHARSRYAYAGHGGLAAAFVDEGKS